MRLTAKGRYAVTSMLDLALHHSEGPTRSLRFLNGRTFHCRILSNYSAPFANRVWSEAFGAPAEGII